MQRLQLFITVILATMIIATTVVQAKPRMTKMQVLELRRQNRLRTISRLKSRGYVVKKVLRVIATAYAIGDGHTPGTHTRCGVLAKKGVVAVDNKYIPLHSRLYIPGYGLGNALDTGGKIKKWRIDLCVNSVAEAEAFGVRSIDVYIVYTFAKLHESSKKTPAAQKRFPPAPLREPVEYSFFRSALMFCGGVFLLISI